MSIKTILALLNGETKDAIPLQAAFLIGKTFNAHCDGLYVTPDIANYVYPDIGVPNPAVGSYIEAFEKASQERLKKAQTLFLDTAKAHTIPVDELAMPLQQASASFISAVGDIEAIVSRKGKLADIIVMQGKFEAGNAPYKSLATAAMFGTGRPVLFTAKQVPSSIGKNVLVSWNGSVESARALAAAMPFLHKATKVHVLAVSDKDAEKEHSAQEVILYLKSHGIEASCLVSDHQGFSTGMVVLNKAKELKVDLIVMGAFTHTRLRQMIMGGVTSFMMEYTEIPVLMVH